MSRRGETEDGLGWGGLVASKAEQRAEREHDAEMARLREQNATLKRDLVYARDGLTKGRTRMREDIARLTDATRWRNVEDEQPRNGQEVLATIFPYRNKINRQMIVHAVYMDALWLDPADREPLHEPTHWMPAPALPDGA